MKLPFRKQKEYVPVKDIPARNDKAKAYDVKSRWDLLLIMYVEAIAFLGMILFANIIDYWGFILGTVITLAICFVLVALVLFIYMWRKISLTEKIGKKNGCDINAYNKDNEKYEDNFLFGKIEEIMVTETPKEIKLTQRGKGEQPAETPDEELEDPDTENPPLPDKLKLFQGQKLMPRFRLYKIRGAFRKKKPLEEFMLITARENKLPSHLEFPDSTATFHHGAISVKKDVATLVLKEIGKYGEHQLPFCRVDSSCVSRRDGKLLEADLETALRAIEAEDHWEAKELKKEIHGLEKVVNSQDKMIVDLLDKIEKLKMKHDQIDEVGEDEKPKDETTLGQKVKYWLERVFLVAVGALALWLYYKLTGVIP